MQCDELKEHGASVGESPAAVVKKCKYTIGMLSDPPAALSVSRNFHQSMFNIFHFLIYNTRTLKM